jgi:hypothetical protein
MNGIEVPQVKAIDPSPRPSSSPVTATWTGHPGLNLMPPISSTNPFSAARLSAIKRAQDAAPGRHIRTEMVLQPTEQAVIVIQVTSPVPKQALKPLYQEACAQQTPHVDPESAAINGAGLHPDPASLPEQGRHVWWPSCPRPVKSL